MQLYKCTCFETTHVIHTCPVLWVRCSSSWNSTDSKPIWLSDINILAEKVTGEYQDYEECENEINIWVCAVWDLNMISSCTNKRKLEIVSRSCPTRWSRPENRMIEMRRNRKSETKHWLCSTQLEKKLGHWPLTELACTAFCLLFGNCGQRVFFPVSIFGRFSFP